MVKFPRLKNREDQHDVSSHNFIVKFILQFKRWISYLIQYFFDSILLSLMIVTGIMVTVRE